MGLKEKQYLNIRRRLDELGYHQPVSVDSILLVDKLLCDLALLHQQLGQYKSESKEANAKCNELEQSLIPYQSENKNLIRENNELHRTILLERDDAAKTIKGLKEQLVEVENSYSDLEFAYMEQLANISELHQDILLKNEKLLEMENSSKVYTDSRNMIIKNSRKLNRKTVPSTSFYRQTNASDNLRSINSVNNCISQVLGNSSKADALKELEQLRKDKTKLLHTIEFNNHQVEIRDGEIQRLGKLLEKKTPIFVPGNVKCNCHSYNEQDSIDLNPLLKQQLEDAQQKQHEAMEKATDLMDRVNNLEERLAMSQQKQTRCFCSEHKFKKLQEEHNKCLLKAGEFKTNESVHLENLKQEKVILEKRLKAVVEENEELNEKLSTLSFKVSKDKDGNSSQQGEKHKTKHRCCDCFQKQCKSHNKIRSSTSETEYSDSETREPIICPHKNVIKTLKKEKKEAVDELFVLQNEITRLKDNFAGLSHEKHNDKCNNEVIKLQFEDKMKSYELEKNSLSTKLSNVTTKLQSSEQYIEKLRRNLEELTTECANWKAKYNHLKVLNDHLELTVRNAEEAEKNKESDVKSSILKIKSLEAEIHTLENSLTAMQKERVTLRGSLHLLDKEKDALMIKLDEKTVQVSKIEQAIKQKNTQINTLEQQISNLQAQLQTLERMLTSTENKAHCSNKDIRKMEVEISSLISCKENLLYENRRLQNDIGALTQDNLQMSKALESSREEVENLKIRLQTYVEEVRRVDELLQIKENEREELLEQFKALSAEAIHLESNNQSLEFESTNAKRSLQTTQDKLHNLEWTIENKNSLVNDMENQITDLSSKVADLQFKVSEKDNIETILSSDLDAARNLCSSLEKQKQLFNEQIWDLQQNETMMKQELEKLKGENKVLGQRIVDEQRNKYTLEDVLVTSRQETMEKSLYNHNLKTEVENMKHNVHTLENKLAQLTQNLERCQKSCSEYRSENIQLQRDLTNEKFERAKADESMSFSTSL